MKKNKKRKIKYYFAACFFTFLALLELVLISLELLQHRRQTDIPKNIIYAVFAISFAFYLYYKAKTVGTDKDDEDERDEFIVVKTDHQMYKIANWLIYILSLIFMTGAAFMYEAQGFTTLVIILTTIAATLSVLWNLLLLIEMIIGITNELRN